MSSSVAEQLRYDPETGHLWWKKQSWNKARNMFEPAGFINKSGHKAVMVDGKQYYQHRVVWFLMTGNWPDHTIDHINGDPADNRWCNLRAATKKQNAANKKGRGGLRGVWFNPKTDKWRAQCGGGKMYVGEYDCPAAAHFAYLVEASRRFGEFAYA